MRFLPEGSTMKIPAVLCAGALVLLAGCAGTGSGPSATAQLDPRTGSKVSGSVTFTQAGEVVRITGQVTGHTRGPKGFHIHERGDCSDPKAMSAGGHFNPRGHKHAGPADDFRHAGDLGNLTFNEQGVAVIDITVTGISVARDRPDGIIGRAVIVHLDPDDLKSDPTGNAGGRAACGVIRD